MSAQPVEDPSLPADVAAEDVWSVPAEWRRAVHPIRGVDDVPPLTASAAAYDELLAGCGDAVRARLTDASTEGDLRAAGLAALGQPRRLLRRAAAPTPSGLGLAAVAAAMVREVGWRDLERTAQAVADGWWSSAPVDAVVTAAVELSGLRCADDHSWQRGVQRGSVTATYYAAPQRIVLVRLRRLLAAADDPTWAAALRALDAARYGGHGALVAAYLAPTPDWVSAAVADRSRSGSYAWPLLLTSVRTAADARTVWQQGTWSLESEGALFTSLAAHLGPAAAPVLLSALDAVDTAEARRRFAGLLAALPSDEAVAALLSRLDRRGVSEAVLRGKEQQPRRAARLLAEAAAGSGASARTCAALLRTHLSAHPETREVASLLRPAARAALEAAVPAQDERPVAPADRLPPVLASAPWERRRTPVKPVVVPGLTPGVPTAVSWQPGEQDRWRRRPQPWMTQTKDWDEALRADRWARFALLSVAPREIGRRHLATSTPGTTWCEPEDARGLLALHETDAVPLLLALTQESPRLADALLPVSSPEVARAMADWLQRTKSVRPVATAWLLRHPETAAAALVPAALGKPGKERRAAERALRLVAGRAREVVERVAASYGPEAEAGITALLSVDPLDVLPAKVPALPAWLDLHALPPVLLADRSARLAPDAVARLVTCLALSAPGEAYAGVEQSLPALDPRSVAELGWALLEAWRLVDEPAKDGWVLSAQGLVGDDETARRLSPLVTAWPKQGGSAKAAAGLEVLAAIGTDVALMHLHRIAGRAASKPLRERATALVQRVAEDLGLSTDQLADRLVPDFGLDPDGRTVLDYGARQFVVGFDEALKPYVEEGGRRRPALPKPGAKDDPELSAAASSRFTALKKDVRVVAADQLRRLEQAMAGQRRWTAEEQRRLFVDHPLLWHLTRRLVWAVFDADGRPSTAFRVAEDRTLADRDDVETTLPPEALVGIAHPLHLGADLGAWTELFADYEVLQPFPQLGREVLRLTDEERAADVLTRFAARPVETKRVYGLAARGWERAAPEDGGVQDRLEKLLPHGRVGIVDLEPGIVVGMPDEHPEQRFTAVRVLRATDDRWRAPSLPLAELDDVTASEVLRDLSRVAG